MGIFKLTCTGTNCLHTFKVNSGNWDITKEFIFISCPVCGKKLKKFINSRYDPAAKLSDGKTELISGVDKKEIYLAGWLMDKSTGEHYELEKDRQTIGRKNSNTVSDIPLNTDNLSVSGAHCIIETDRGDTTLPEFLLLDNGSKNGVLINGRKLKKLDRYYLNNNDTIHLGTAEFIFLRMNKDNE